MSIPKDELTNSIQDTVEAENTSELNNIESRIAESDMNKGVSLTLTGGHIPIRPIIEYIATIDDWKIESIGISPSAEKIECSNCETERFNTGLTLFCAYIDESESQQLSKVFTDE